MNDRVLDYLMGEIAERTGTVVMDYPEHPPIDSDTGYRALIKQRVEQNDFSRVEGNALEPRAHVDTWRGSYYLMKGSPLSADGTLLSWRFFALAAEPVQLVICRLLGSAASVVCRSALVTAKPGINDISLAGQGLVRRPGCPFRDRQPS